MQIQVLTIGKLAKGPVYDLVKEYLKRFSWQVTLQEITARKMSTSQHQKEHEAQLLLNALPKASKCVVLDERGDNLDTLEIADKVSQWQIHGFSSISFIIGGADGLSETVRQRADWVLGFGRMTWPHMLMRVLLMEQLYRVQQVLAHHPYHRQ